MAIVGAHGRPVLSAGEIGAYTVCPESWRLRAMDKRKGERSERVERGQVLHREWSERIEASHWLERSVRMVAALLITAILMFLLVWR